MSAFVVNYDTIDLIVSAARKLDVRFPLGSELIPVHGNEDRIGEVLVLANVLSVNHRYASDEEVTQYEFRGVNMENVGMGQDWRLIVIAAMNCLRYQSCEHPGWDTSTAERFLTRVQTALLGDMTRSLYSPWEWTRDKALARREAVLEDVKANLYRHGSEGTR